MKTGLSIFLCLLIPAILFSQDTDPFLRGLAKMEQKKYVEAIDEFSLSTSSGNYKPEVLLNRAICYQEKGDYQKAIADLLTAEKRKKNLGSYHLARSYAMIGKTDSAIYYLSEHLSSPYKLPESNIKLDQAFNDLENTPLWRELWNKEWYNEFEILLAEIYYLINHAKYLEALDLIDQNLTEYAHRHQIYAARGNIFLQLKNFNSAITAYSRAIEINKANPDCYYKRSAAYSALEKYENALDDINWAISLEPENFKLYPERSRLYNKLGIYSKAIEDISFYLILFPEDEQALFLCGRIYFDKGIYSKAIDYFNKCLKTDQSRAEYFIARGNAYFETKTYGYAIQDYGMALDLDPRNPETYLNKGLARFYINDKDGACYDWENAAGYGSFKALELLSTHCRK